MKKKSIFGFMAAVIFAAGAISSCKSSEINTTPVPTSGSQNSAVSSSLIPANEYISGIFLSEGSSDAQTAAPIPHGGEIALISSSDTEDDVSISFTEETTSSPSVTKTEETTSTAAVVTTAAASELPQTTISATMTEAQNVSSAQTTVPAQTTASEASTAAATLTQAPAPVTAYTGGSYGRNSYQALNYSRVKAVWISYIEMNAYLSGKSEQEFRNAFGKMLDNCSSLGLNTVFVHVRAFGDSFYFSGLFPFTSYLGGKTSYDPLKIMVDEAHSRNISFHAWINPMRLCSDQMIMNISSAYPVGKWYNGAEKGKYIVKVNGTWYLNPGYEAVRTLISDNVREIVSGYNVDGIHIDDYFYPTTDASFDSDAFSASGYQGLSAFRTASCNAMVKGMYDAVHECGTAVFGAAPQGNNNNNLYVLYADTAAWCKGGYVDYFAPQIYYGFENTAVPFKKNVDEWLGIVKGTKTKLYPGLSLYKIGKEDTWAGAGKTEWQNTTTMIKRQIEYAEENGCAGVALYSYNYLFNDTYLTSTVKSEIENFKPLLTK